MFPGRAGVLMLWGLSLPVHCARSTARRGGKTWAFSKFSYWLGLLLVSSIYYIVAHYRWGATYGKHLMGIRVARKDGGPAHRCPASIWRWTGFLAALIWSYIGWWTASRIFRTVSLAQHAGPSCRPAWCWSSSCRCGDMADPVARLNHHFRGEIQTRLPTTSSEAPKVVPMEWLERRMKIESKRWKNTRGLSIGSNGHLHFSGTDLVPLAKKFGTPLYVLSEDLFRESCRQRRAAFDKLYPDSLVIFATKRCA